MLPYSIDIGTTPNKNDLNQAISPLILPISNIFTILDNKYIQIEVGFPS